jgi:hypothetical protein
MVFVLKQGEEKYFRTLGAVSKLSFGPTSVLTEKFNPQNTPCIPPVKFFSRLELEPKS